MAGSGSRKDQQSLKNQAMIVVRNITQQEVTNVIFPNGITVGAVDGPFRNGMRIHGNAQVSGIVNAQGFKVNGSDLVSSGQPFLFLDIDAPTISFDDDSDRSPDPTSVAISITQSGQAATVQSSDISAQDTDGTDLTSTITGITVTETSTGNSFTTATLDLSSGPATIPTKYPITVTVSKGGLTSTKKISAAVGGEDGTNGTNGADGADGADGVGYTIHLSNPAHTLYTTTAGAVTYTGSGTNISVFKNGVELNGILSGTPSTGEFSVTSVSASGITEGARTSPGNPIICAQGSNMTQNTASIVYTLNLENSVTVTASQSLTKSRQGDPPEVLILDLDSTTVAFDDASDTSPTPSSVGITITQAGQASTIVSGDITATEQDGVTSVTISSVSTTASSTGNSVTTATIASPPTDPTKYPVTVEVNNDGRSSSKKIVSVVGGEDGAAGSSAIIQLRGASMSVEAPANPAYTNSQFNITDLSTEVVNVGSVYTLTNIINAANEIDSGAASLGNDDSIRISAGTHKIDITVTLDLGESPSTYDPGRGIAGITGKLYAVRETTVDHATHGSTDRDYGTESTGTDWSVSYPNSGQAYSGSGRYLTIQETLVVTVASNTFVWARLDYSEDGDFQNGSGVSQTPPSITISLAKMTATKIA